MRNSQKNLWSADVYRKGHDFWDHSLLDKVKQNFPHNMASTGMQLLKGHCHEKVCEIMT
jgi:hypothetical protein